MINVLHVSQVGMNVGGTEECIYALCKYFDKDIFSNYIWSPFGGGVNLDLLIKEGHIKGFSLTNDGDELIDFVLKNHIGIIMVHSGALNKYCIIPSILAFKGFAGISIIEIMHRPLPSWGAPYGISKIIAVSHYVATKQLAEYRDITEVIHNGIDVEVFKRYPSQNAESRIKYGISSTAFVFGFLGHLETWKRPQDIVEVAQKISGVNRNAYFVIGGDGSLRSIIEEQINKLRLSNIKMLGRIEKKNRIEFFSMLNAFIFPTVEDALPLVVCEAMAMALPIISYKIGPLPEMFPKESELYFLAPFRDTDRMAEACLKIADDPGEYQRLSGNNLGTSSYFDMKNVIKKYEAMIRDVQSGEGSDVSVSNASLIYRHIGDIAFLRSQNELAETNYHKAISIDPAVKDDIEDHLNEIKAFFDRVGIGKKH